MATRRNCHVDSSNCTAVEHYCRKCNKKGHFPKSINCKARRKISKEDPMENRSSDCQKTFKMSSDLLFLVKKRIKEIEYYKEMDNQSKNITRTNENCVQVASCKEKHGRKQ